MALVWVRVDIGVDVEINKCGPSEAITRLTGGAVACEPGISRCICIDIPRESG